MKIILKNLIVNNPYQKLEKKISSLEITDGIITGIDKKSDNSKKDVKEYDLKGKLVVPGFFDMHVHLREPGNENAETVLTGCRSAAKGGFTEITCMPNTNPTIDSASVVALIKQKSFNELTKVHIVAAATKDREGEKLAPMAELFKNGSLAFSDDGCAIKTAVILKNAMLYAKMFDLPIIEHCEDESMSGGSMNESLFSTKLGLEPVPSIAEYLIIMRDILMAEYTDSKIHIAHISTKEGVQMVREAKNKGIKVTAEVAPHHFTLDDSYLTTYDTNYKMNPPLRGKEDVKEILKGLKDGTIDCIASDHAPHTLNEKEKPFDKAPNGIIGLETEIGLTLTELYQKNILTINQIIEKLSINPRIILKQPIPLFKEGEIANLTILDLDKEWTVDCSKFFSKSINTPFCGRKLKGKSVGVINNKKMFFQDKYFNI